MHWLSILLLGISTDLDNMFLGISLGLQGKQIRFLMNAVIGLFSAAATLFVCFFAAQTVTHGRVPNLIGGGIILLAGILSVLPHRETQPSTPTSLRWHDIALLGVSLAVNCVPTAFGAGLTGLSPWAAALSVGLLSIFAVAVGNRLGRTATTLRLGQRTLRLLGGAMMIGLGLMEVLI